MSGTNNLGRAICLIADYLSIPLETFVEDLSAADENNSISPKTLYKAATGGSIRKRWSFREFWRRVDSAVTQYTDSSAEIDQAQKHDVNQKWEQEKENLESACRCLFLDIDAPELAADFPFDAQIISGHFEDNKAGLIDALRPIILGLSEQNKQIVYKYQRNFPAYASITEYDLKFIKGVLNMSPKEKEALQERMKKQQTVDAGTMMDRLNSAELQHWLETRNNSYAEASRHGNEIEKSWDSFCKKCEQLSGWRLFILLKFFFFTLAGPDAITGIDSKIDFGTKVTLDPNRFSSTEIDLFLMFKYILTEEAQDKIMNNL